MDLEIQKGLFATPHRFLWHSATHTAILADLHMGVEKQLAQEGIFMPDVTTAGIRPSWQALVDRNPSRVIVAGDLFDAPAPDGETIEAVLALLARLPAGCEVTVIPGNHDPEFKSLCDVFEETDVHVSYTADIAGWTVAHGHELRGRKSSSSDHTETLLALDPPPPTPLIVGHQHPAVVLADGVQKAKMYCYAVCRMHAHDRGGRQWPMIVLPAFSHAPLGSNLLTQRHWIMDVPRPAAEDVRIAGIVGDNVLDFGPLAGLG